MARGNGGFWADFRKFIAQGNVLDLAVAVVIGGAFGKIVTSLVEDIITPAILDPAIKAAGVEQLSQLTIPGTAIKYGAFLAAILNFLVIALSLFLIIRAVQQAKRRLLREEAADPAADPIAQNTEALNRLTATLESRRM